MIGKAKRLQCGLSEKLKIEEPSLVIPAQAGIQAVPEPLNLDFRFHGNDGSGH
jgi:hypothetical protein